MSDEDALAVARTLAELIAPLVAGLNEIAVAYREIVRLVDRLWFLMVPVRGHA